MEAATVAVPVPVPDSPVGADDSPQPPPRQRWRRWQRSQRWWRWIPAPVTAITAAVVTRRFWLADTYVAPFDAATYSGPNLDVTIDALRDGRLALWNDAIFGGVTHLGNPQAGTLYPPRLLGLLFETNRAMGVLVALHVVFLGLGMVVLARRLGLGTVARTLAGVAAVCSGAVLTKAGQLEQILVLAWAPWLLVAVHATLHGRRPWRATAGLAAVTAGTLLAGHPQIVYESAFLAVVALVGWAATGGRWRRLAHVAIGVGLGALIAAPQLLAALIATRESALAGGRPIADLRAGTFVVEDGDVARSLLGTVLDFDPAVFMGNFERISFVGVAVVLLAAVGFVDGVRRRGSRSFTIALGAGALIALAWSHGPAAWAFRVVYGRLPGFDLGRVSARWLVVVAFILVLLAAVGIDAILRRPSAGHLAVVLVAAAFGTGLVILTEQTIPEHLVGVWWAVTAVALIAGVALSVRRTGPLRRFGGVMVTAIVAFELGALANFSLPLREQSSQPFTAFASATTEWLAERDDGLTIALTDDLQPADYSVPGLRPNANVLNGIRSVDGYDGGVQVTKRWAAALRRLVPDPDATLPLRNSLDVPIQHTQLARLGVRYVLIDRERPAELLVPGWLGPRAEDDRFAVWENPAYLGEAISWSSARQVEPTVAADVLRENLGRLHSTALVSFAGEEFDCQRRGPCRPVGLPIERSSPEHLAVTTDLDHRTIVSIAQQFSPGWHATLDGEEVELIEVDGLYLGVDVPSGTHRIELEYRPDWLRPALIAAGVAIVVTLLLAVVRLPSRLRKVGGPSVEA